MRESNDNHVCPVEGCAVADVPVDKLMCPYHWGLVPAALRREVYRTWNRGGPHALYKVARRQAIEAAKSAERG